FVWMSMQYGHCVVSATATAISSLYLSGTTPLLNAASSNATKPLNASGASSPSRGNFFRLFISYMTDSLKKKPYLPSMVEKLVLPAARCETVLRELAVNSALVVHPCSGLPNRIHGRRATLIAEATRASR